LENQKTKGLVQKIENRGIKKWSDYQAEAGTLYSSRMNTLEAELRDPRVARGGKTGGSGRVGTLS